MTDYGGQFGRLLAAHRKLILEHAACQQKGQEPNMGMRILLQEAGEAVKIAEKMAMERKQLVHTHNRSITKESANSGRIQGLQVRLAETQEALAEAEAYIRQRQWAWHNADKFTEFLRRHLDANRIRGKIGV